MSYSSKATFFLLLILLENSFFGIFVANDENHCDDNFVTNNKYTALNN